jgi:hypothetical protein
LITGNQKNKNIININKLFKEQTLFKFKYIYV